MLGRICTTHPSASFLVFALVIAACSSKHGAKDDAGKASARAAGRGAGGGSGTGDAAISAIQTDSGHAGASDHDAGMLGAGGRGAIKDGAISIDAAPRDSGAQAGSPYLYVSGYGSNITLFSLDPSTFAAQQRGTVNGGTSPSYLAIAPSKRYLYAINEADAPNSKVVAFALDGANGQLSKLNEAQTGGSGSPHLAVHPSGKWIAVAHYGSGHTSIMPVLDTGGVGDPSDIKKGPSDGCAKAHQAVFDSTGDYLFVPCLQSNYVIQYKFSQGKLGYNTPATVTVMGGPRHMAFDPGEHYAYVVSEIDSLITSFKYDSSKGTLSDPQTIDSYEQTKGASAQIAVHPSGHWLYASNRTENSIGLFSIDVSGRPHPVAFQKDMIATPRDFSLDPSGAFLISANQDGAQNVLVFKIDPNDGALTRIQVMPVGGQPTFTKVVLLP